MKIVTLWTGGLVQAMSHVQQVYQEVQYLIYSLQGGNGTESAENCNTVGQSQQEADQAMVLKGNM